jgi:hypothetical protein
MAPEPPHAQDQTSLRAYSRRPSLSPPSLCSVTDALSKMRSFLWLRTFGHIGAKKLRTIATLLALIDSDLWNIVK